MYGHKCVCSTVQIFSQSYLNYYLDVLADSVVDVNTICFLLSVVVDLIGSGCQLDRYQDFIPV